MESCGLLLGVLRHLVGEALGGLAQVLHQLLDLLVARAALERLAQSLLGGAQVALGLRGVAVLDLLGHRPQKGGDVEQIRVAARVSEGRVRLLEAEIDIRRRVEQFRRDAEAVERRLDALGRMVRVEDQIAPLFDERARQRIVERPLRKRDFDRRARAALARHALRAQRHQNVRAGPRMFGKIDRGARVADAVDGRRRFEAGLGRLSQASRRGLFGVVRKREIGARAGDPIAVVEPVGEGQGAADVGLGVLGQFDRGDAGRRDREGDLGGLGAAAQDRRLAVAVDRPAPFGGRAGTAGFVVAFRSIGAIAPSTSVSTTPGSPRTTSTESSYTVMVLARPRSTSITTGGRPA